MRRTDVLVVGGGIVGLAAAWRLRERGLSVTVLERGGAGKEASTRAAGLLMPQAETDPPGSPDSLEESLFRVLCRARDRYPDFLAAVDPGHTVPWHLDGVLTIARTAEEAARLRDRVDDQTSRGLAAEFLEEDALSRRATVNGQAGGWFPRDGMVEPPHLLAALAAAVRGAGVEIHEETGVDALTVEGDRVTGARTRTGTHPAGAVLLAAGAWTEALLPPGEPGLGIHPVRGEMVVFSGPPASPILTSGETYLVPRRDGTVLAGSTLVEAGFDREVPEASVTDIAARARDLHPPARTWTIERVWSGLRPRAADPYPIVGPARHRGLWISGGHFRNGVLLASETGEWIASLVAGDPVPEAAPFHPGRFA